MKTMRWRRAGAVWAVAILLAALAAAGCASDGREKQMRMAHDDALADIVHANGLDQVYLKKALYFTFNVRLPDKEIHRSWEVRLPENRIFMDGREVGETGAFVNDVHWLLFPLKAWEAREQTDVFVQHGVASPVTGQRLTEVTVQYKGSKGFTPDDMYKLYVDDAHIIREWAYYRGGQSPPARVTTWEAYRDVGGMRIATMHSGPGGFAVWFTGVRAE